MTVIPELRDELRRAAMRNLAATLAAAGSPTRRRRVTNRLRRGGLPLVAVLVVGTSGIATGAGFVISQSTKDRSTALVGAPAPTSGHPGKFARLGNEMVAQATEIESHLPYPPGLRDHYDWSKYSAGATLGTGGETRREMAIMIEYRAQCLWRIAYLRSFDSGDERGADDALTILQQASKWPATRSLAGSEGADLPLQHLQDGDIAWLRQDVRINCSDMVPNGINPLRHK